MLRKQLPEQRPQSLGGVVTVVNVCYIISRWLQNLFEKSVTFWHRAARVYDKAQFIWPTEVISSTYAGETKSCLKTRSSEHDQKNKQIKSL